MKKINLITLILMSVFFMLTTGVGVSAARPSAAAANVDLVVTRIEGLPANGNLTVGQSTQFTPYVKNTSTTTAAGPFKVRFYKDGQWTGNEAYFSGGLAANTESNCGQLGWTFTVPGSHTFSITVDYYNDVAESNETNNTGSVSFTVSEVVSTPQNVAANATSSSAITVSWQAAPSNTTGFKVYRYVGNAYVVIATVAGSSTSFNDSGLAPDTMYYYYVTRLTAGGESAAAPANTRTLATAPTGFTATNTSSP
ncbi:MAG: CARDB domain-containing protein, partial [Candidatus Omnitrophota bacterium]